ncbi:MAG: hypothetical protein ACOZQL_10460 [Myxococcota bacterium]
MSDHLSPLALDEVAAGLSTGEPHLATCAGCRAKVDARRAANAAFLARPEARRKLEQLAPPRRSPAPRLLALVVPLAAALALVFFWPRGAPTEPAERLKGAPAVSLRDAAGNAVTAATVGQQLTLSVAAAGFSQVTIVSRAPDGGHETLFSGGIEGDGRVDLLQLEVTPGDVELTADFTDGQRHQTAQTRLEVR